MESAFVQFLSEKKGVFCFVFRLLFLFEFGQGGLQISR